MGRPIESRALAVMREAQDWKANRLARALGLQPDTLYEYERGRLVPSRNLLERAAAAMGLPAHHVDWTLRYLRLTDAGAAASSADPEAEADREIDRFAIAMGMEWEEIHRSQLTRSTRLAKALAERQAARVHFPRLRAYPAAQRQAIVREVKDFQTWAVGELACHESIEAAADDADEALAWAELAVLIGDLAPGEEAFRSRFQGYAAFHRGNARRVKGRLPLADEEFRRANMLWQAGAEGDPEKLLNEARVLGMEASLRRDQRHLPEALALLDRALALGESSETVYLLINRAKALEELDDYEEAITTLRRTLPLLDADREPRLFWNLTFNLAESLVRAGRHEEARPTLEQVRKIALRLGNGLRLVHHRWLEGLLATGLCRPDEAERAFEEVRQAFLERDIPFNAGVVTLELAVLYLEQGRTAEVRRLARELAPVFQEQRVSREALATLLLFRDAVERETLTLEMARRLVKDLRRSPDQKEFHLAKPADGDPARQGQGRRRPGKIVPEKA